MFYGSYLLRLDILISSFLSRFFSDFYRLLALALSSFQSQTDVYLLILDSSTKSIVFLLSVYLSKCLCAVCVLFASSILFIQT